MITKILLTAAFIFLVMWVFAACVEDASENTKTIGGLIIAISMIVMVVCVILKIWI